jgi:hypothetical protein
MAVYHLWKGRKQTEKVTIPVLRLGIALGIGFSSIPTNSPVIFKRQRYKKTVSDALPAVMFVLAFFFKTTLFTPWKGKVFI